MKGERGRGEGLARIDDVVEESMNSLSVWDLIRESFWISGLDAFDDDLVIWLLNFEIGEVVVVGSKEIRDN